MAPEKPLKSAYELAMERLRAKDREDGVEERPLDDDQKREIARLRRDAQAKLAEMEILHRKNVQGASGTDELAKLEESYRIDRARVESRLESAVAKVKRGSAAPE